MYIGSVVLPSKKQMILVALLYMNIGIVPAFIHCFYPKNLSVSTGIEAACMLLSNTGISGTCFRKTSICTSNSSEKLVRETINST